MTRRSVQRFGAPAIKAMSTPCICALASGREQRNEVSDASGQIRYGTFPAKEPGVSQRSGGTLRSCEGAWPPPTSPLADAGGVDDKNDVERVRGEILNTFGEVVRLELQAVEEMPGQHHGGSLTRSDNFDVDRGLCELTGAEGLLLSVSAVMKPALPAPRTTMEERLMRQLDCRKAWRSLVRLRRKH